MIWIDGGMNIWRGGGKGMVTRDVKETPPEGWYEKYRSGLYRQPRRANQQDFERISEEIKRYMEMTGQWRQRLPEESDD
jgi:hypothetical protein